MEVHLPPDGDVAELLIPTGVGRDLLGAQEEAVVSFVLLDDETPAVGGVVLRPHVVRSASEDQDEEKEEQRVEGDEEVYTVARQDVSEIVAEERGDEERPDCAGLNPPPHHPAQVMRTIAPHDPLAGLEQILDRAHRD
ncbi:MAG TPA: hypothetical protein VFF73_31300 [Planctomycetota bacterium]|nr:hypothetical protein [Planctomycetota bacterium]